MTSLMAKACVAFGAAFVLAQPASAQDAGGQDVERQPAFRSYSDVRAERTEAEQRAYAQGRADEAASHGDYAPTPPPKDDTAYDASRRYDGYCYQRQAHAQTTGTILGAVSGALIGNSVSNRWDRGSNTIGGAMVGAMLGSAVGRDSVSCYQGAYYAYDDGYYAPPPPPRGYVTVFFSSRPSYGGYRRVYDGHRGYYGHRRHW